MTLIPATCTCDRCGEPDAEADVPAAYRDHYAAVCADCSRELQRLETKTLG